MSKIEPFYNNICLSTPTGNLASFFYPKKQSLSWKEVALRNKMVWKDRVMKNKWGLGFPKRKKISRWETGFKPAYCSRLVESLMLDFVPTFSIVDNWRFLTEMEQAISYQNNNPKWVDTHYIYRIMSPQSQKGKPCEKDLPLLKNDIPNILEPQKPVIR